MKALGKKMPLYANKPWDEAKNHSNSADQQIIFNEIGKNH